MIKGKMLLSIALGMFASGTMISSSFADVIVTDSNAQSVLRVQSHEGILYFQKCDGNEVNCTPFGNPQGYSEHKVNKIQSQIHISEALDIGEGTFTVVTPALIICGMAAVGMLAPPAGGMMIVGYLSASGGAAIAVGGGHDAYEGFQNDHAVSQAIQIGENGGDRVITVQSIDDYEQNLLRILSLA